MIKSLVQSVLFVGLLSCGAARADILIQVDELGNGVNTVGPGFIGNDPGPGGLNNVLIYNLPFAGVQGDVLMVEPNDGVLDVIRFNGNGTLIFYSDNIGGADAPADTPSPPGSFYANQVRINEVGPEGDNGAFYTPLTGQPGFDPTAGVTYQLVSDGTAPEPASLALLGIGIIGMVRLVAQRRRLCP